MEIPESKRADVYVAQGNINLSGLLAGAIGLVMLAAALRSKKIVQRNRKTAVSEEISYQSQNMGIYPKIKKDASSVKIRPYQSQITNLTEMFLTFRGKTDY